MGQTVFLSLALKQDFRLGDIRINTRINTSEIDEKTVAEYQADMLAYGKDTWQARWKIRPKVTSTRQLWSLFHTLAATTRAFGLAHVIECEVEGDTSHDPFLLATRENADPSNGCLPGKARSRCTAAA